MKGALGINLGGCGARNACRAGLSRRSGPQAPRLLASPPGSLGSAFCPQLARLASNRSRQGGEGGRSVLSPAAQPGRVAGAAGATTGRLQARGPGHEQEGGEEAEAGREPRPAKTGEEEGAEGGEDTGIVQDVVKCFPRPAIAGGFLAVAVGGYLLLQHIGLNPLEMIESSIDAKHPISPFIFGVTYVLSCVAFIPASVLTLGAGYMYGPVEGTALVSVSSTLGAGAAFLISRYVARPYIEELLMSNRKFKAVDTAIANEGYKVIFLLRLSPLVPFNLSNYLYGISNVPFLQYMIASWAGMLPGTLAYVQLGSMGRAGADAMGVAAEGGSMDAARLGLYALGAVATLVAAKLAADTAERAEEGMLDLHPDEEEEGDDGNKKMK